MHTWTTMRRPSRTFQDTKPRTNRRDIPIRSSGPQHGDQYKRTKKERKKEEKNLQTSRKPREKTNTIEDKDFSHIEGREFRHCIGAMVFISQDNTRLESSMPFLDYFLFWTTVHTWTYISADGVIVTMIVFIGCLCFRIWLLLFPCYFIICISCRS